MPRYNVRFALWKKDEAEPSMDEICDGTICMEPTGITLVGKDLQNARARNLARNMNDVYVPLMPVPADTAETIYTVDPRHDLACYDDELPAVALSRPTGSWLLVQPIPSPILQRRSWDDYLAMRAYLKEAFGPRVRAQQLATIRDPAAPMFKGLLIFAAVVMVLSIVIAILGFGGYLD